MWVSQVADNVFLGAFWLDVLHLVGKLVLRGDGLFVQGFCVRAASPAHVGAGAWVAAAHAGLGEGFAGRVACLTEGFVGGWVFRLDEIDL